MSGAGPSAGVAVVTGAARGLGATFAIALADAGHDVAVLDLVDGAATCDAVTARGRRAIALIGDAASPADVAGFADQVRVELGATRVLVNNAGISPYAPFDQTDLALWQQVSRVNLDSMFLLTQAFLPDLLADGAGRIVNLTSSVVWDAQARDMVAYATTKAGVVGFTRALAGELGQHGVTVNAIAPGIVLTPDITSRVPDQKLQAYLDRQSIKSLMVPDDLAAALVFLTSRAAGHVTGTVLPVNGGRVLL